MDYTQFIRDVADFPKAGILFKDITPLLGNAAAMAACIKDMTAPFLNDNIQIVVGMESRGFLFGPGIAQLLNCGFAPVRKPGKLPFTKESISYELEYGSDSLEIHVDAFKKGDRVLVVDDLLATGGTAAATVALVEKIGGLVAGFSFVIELDFLKGRQALGDAKLTSLLHY